MNSSILIVDDNTHNLRVLEEILAAEDHDICMAVNGELALRSVATRTPELILLDIMMPGMDGFEVCRHLKADPVTADIPVLFISALAEPDVLMRAFEAGGLDYITKPFVEQEVLARVRTHLRLAAAQRQLLEANRELSREIETRNESEKKYRHLFEESKDVILVSDPTGRLLDVNQAGIELFGYTREELLSLDPRELYCSPGDRKRMWQVLYHAGFVNDFELEMKGKNGRAIIVHLSVSIIRDDEGKIFGHRGIARDVTERRKLERQLLHSQKMESIGLLAGGVAHDFNNLLTAISGYGQILQDSVPENDEVSQDSIRQVLKAAGRAAELTGSLLAFSRKQAINAKPVHVYTIISDTARLIQRVIGEDIEFTTAFSGKDLLVMADAGQLEQVFMNLATNARDAMPHGGRLSICLKRVVVKEGSEALYDLPSSGNYALVSVADTGTGIDNGSMDKLFEPFYTTKEVGKGTGLGLSIVYGIIKQHEGSVLVGSEAGKGTTFNIYLPLVEGHAVEEKSTTLPAVNGGTETILLAEDEELVRTFLARILERSGYTVITAEDGEDAVRKFGEGTGAISLVLTDMVMPRKNGMEIFEEISKIDPGTKVIFISGYTPETIHKKGIIPSEVEFITKPFKKDDLLRKVREVLDKN